MTLQKGPVDEQLDFNILSTTQGHLSQGERTRTVGMNSNKADIDTDVLTLSAHTTCCSPDLPNNHSQQRSHHTAAQDPLIMHPTQLSELQSQDPF